MKILLRIVAVILVLIALFLVYAVVATATDEGARVGVAIGYVIGALVLTFAASKLWR